MPDRDKVAVFWDYARVFGCVITFKAYLDISAQPPKNTTLRSELQLSGVSLIDCPHNGKKDVVDKMIMVDMLAFAVDHSPPATVVLVTGDRDYAYAVSTLRLRNYSVILITPTVTTCLEAQASAVVDWSVVLTRTRTEPGSESVVRRSYIDLDDNLFNKLSREVSQLGDDDSTVFSASPPSEASSKSRRVSAQDLLRPTFTKGDNVDNANVVCESGSQAQGLIENPVKTSNTEDSPAVLFAAAVHRPSSSTPALSGRARSATVHSVTPAILDEGSSQRPPDTSRLPAASEVCSDARAPSECSAPKAENVVPSDYDGPLSSILIGSPAKPPLTSFVHSPRPNSVPVLNPRLNLSPTVPNISLKTRTISGGTPVSLGPTKPLALPKLERKLPSSVPILNPFADDFVPSADEDLRMALGLSDSDCEPMDVHTAGGEILPPPQSTMNSIHGDHNAAPTGIDDGSSPSNVEVAQLPLEEHGTPAVSIHEPQVDPEGSNSDDSSYIPAIQTQVAIDVGTGVAPNEVIQQQIRAKFLPLIQQLLADRSKGIVHSGRSEVAVALVTSDKDVYKRMGVLKFKQYAMLAQQAGVVVLGGTSADPWIALHPFWCDREERDRPNCHAESSTSSREDVNPSNALGGVGTGCFQPLVNALVQLRQSGVQRPMRTLVGQELKPSAYQSAGVSSFKQYITRAIEERIVQCGGAGNHAWICLHPDVDV
ncbi:hypothetical protein ID866_3209 [Astraeus odoratus]|nr:hypothetical protein ID866_3209 [Astraeus odoratus]